MTLNSSISHLIFISCCLYLTWWFTSCRYLVYETPTDSAEVSGAAHLWPWLFLQPDCCCPGLAGSSSLALTTACRGSFPGSPPCTSPGCLPHCLVSMPWVVLSPRCHISHLLMVAAQVWSLQLRLGPEPAFALLLSLGDLLCDAGYVRYLGKQNLLEFGSVCVWLFMGRAWDFCVGGCLLFSFTSLNLCDLYEGFIERPQQPQEESSPGEREYLCVSSPHWAHYPSLIIASVWIILLEGCWIQCVIASQLIS